MDFPTAQDLFRIARDEVLTRNPDLKRDIVERDGTDANALTAAGVGIGDALVGTLVRVNGVMFLDSAKKVDLDKLVFDRYQIVRKPAAPAVTTVNFTTTAPAVVGFSIPAGTQLSTPDNRIFITRVQVTFPGGSTGPISVAVQSVLGGLSQQVRANTITSIVSSIPSQPADLAVTNPLASMGAADEESDDALRDRAKNFYPTARKGTLKAIEEGAKAVPGIRTASAFEAIDADGSAARVVELVVADDFVAQLVDSTVLPPVYPAQSVAIAALVRDGLQDVRAGGIQVSVTVANVVLLGISLSLRYRAGADIDAATTAAKVQMVNYINSLRPGQQFNYAVAIDRLRAVPGLVILGGEIASPPGDVLAAPTQVLRTQLDFVTVGQALLATAA